MHSFLCKLVGSISSIDMWIILALCSIGGASAGILPPHVSTGGYDYGVTGGSLRTDYYHNQHHAPIITKEFYIHSAPEEFESEPIHKVVNLGPSRKNYKVVFIKAPGQHAGKVHLSVVQPGNEDKTVIYVLAKKPDLAQIETDVRATPSASVKPEVFFIKYNTHEEAIAAQRQIQAQYDALGGTSHVSDEGVAPVSSVIGSIGTGGHHHTTHTTNIGPGGDYKDLGTSTGILQVIAPSDKYLPSHEIK